MSMFSFLRRNGSTKKSELNELQSKLSTMDRDKFEIEVNEVDIRNAEQFVRNAEICVEKLRKYFDFFEKHGSYDMLEVINQAIAQATKCTEQAKDSFIELKIVTNTHTAKEILSLIKQYSELAKETIKAIEKSATVNGQNISDFSAVSEVDIKNAEYLFEIINECIEKIKEYSRFFQEHNSDEGLIVTDKALTLANECFSDANGDLLELKLLIGFPDFEQKLERIEEFSELSKGAVKAVEDIEVNGKNLLEFMIEPSISEVHQNISIEPTVEIRKYKALLDDGIITYEEFEKKKSELLGSV